MGGCSVPGCFQRRGDRGVTFHKFPSDPSRRTKWLENCGRPNWEPPKSANVCNAHFVENQFELHRADGWKKLKPNAVPTIFPGPEASNRKRRRYKKRKSFSGAKQMDVTSHRQTLHLQLKSRNRRKTTIPARYRTAESDDDTSMDAGKSSSYNQPEFFESNDQDEVSDIVASAVEGVGTVEVCFSSGKQHDAIDCSQCSRLKRTLVNVIDERDSLQRKIYCMNSAIRMLLNKEQRQSLRSLANTISEHWVAPEDE